jgi:deoxyadenosine kinase
MDVGVEKLFIGICGVIGAGKTTLATSLSKVLELPVYYEEVIENTYLEDFYNDMQKYSFPLQIYLLNRRFKQHQQIIWQGKGGVQDRTIYEDSIFAGMLRDANLMEERDHNTYMELFNNMSNFMRKPNLIIYLEVSPEESLKRIKLRNRSMESKISLEYLINLSHAYEKFIDNISKVIPVIKVNWNDYLSAEEMAEKITTQYKHMKTIHQIK